MKHVLAESQLLVKKYAEAEALYAELLKKALLDSVGGQRCATREHSLWTKN